MWTGQYWTWNPLRRPVRLNASAPRIFEDFPSGAADGGLVTGNNSRASAMVSRRLYTFIASASAGAALFQRCDCPVTRCAGGSNRPLHRDRLLPRYRCDGLGQHHHGRGHPHRAGQLPAVRPGLHRRDVGQKRLRRFGCRIRPVGRRLGHQSDGCAERRAGQGQVGRSSRCIAPRHAERYRRSSLPVSS